MLVSQKAKDIEDQNQLVVSIADVNKFLAQSLHSEVQKLSRIMGAEFGDSVKSFLMQYATKVNNDYNNPPK